MENEMQNFIDSRAILVFAEKVMLKYINNLKINEKQKETLQTEMYSAVSNRLEKVLQLHDLSSQKTNINMERIKNITNNICMQIWGKFEIATVLRITEKNINFENNRFVVFGSADNPLQISNFNFDYFDYALQFRYCNFQVKLGHESIISKECIFLSFENCEFLEKIDFYSRKIHIDYAIEIKDCIIHKEFRMDNKIVNVNLYFNNSTFKDYVDFHESKFNQTACFYGVTFEKVPNFSQTIFNGNLNLVNSKLNFGFKECKEAVENELDRRTIITSIPNAKFPVLYEVANDFRDSFRIFKSSLIKDNNLLDASNYHKIELYFKEIELDSKNPKFFSKEWIDLWQLRFYRLTSNHHTDLLKSFNSLIVLIGIFVLFGLGIVVGFNKCLGFYDSNPHAMIEFYNAHIKNAVINDKYIAFGFNAFLSIAFMFLFCICQICGIVRKIALWICYLLTFAMLISSPKYLIPAIGIFTDRQILLDPLAINGSLYTIFFGFMIYSFIKTLRKNSIIPA